MLVHVVVCRGLGREAEVLGSSLGADVPWEVFLVASMPSEHC